MKRSSEARLTPTWLVLAAACWSLFAPTRSQAQGSGLIGYWPMNGNAVNSVTGVSASLTSGATFAAGYNHQALTLGDGADAWTTEFRQQSIGPRTITAWINAQGFFGANPIFTIQYTNPDPVNSPAPTDHFGIANGYQLYVSNTNQNSYLGPSVPTGHWAHVALVWDNNALTFYVNGVGTQVAGALYDSTLDTIYVGGTYGNDTGFPTQFEEVQMYNRALSASDIQSIMNNGLPAAPTPWFSWTSYGTPYYSGTVSSSSGGYFGVDNPGYGNGASLRYTLDGSIPSHTNGTLTTAEWTSFSVACSLTTKAIAYGSWYLDSPVTSVSLIISQGTLAAPSFSPGGGTYVTPQTVTISGPSGATIRYTVDGSTPSETNGTIIASGATLSVSANTTIKAIAYECSWTDSAVASATYTITGQVATPTFNPPGGTYSAAQVVSISTTTSGATIRYTLDGSTPSESHGTIGNSATIRSTQTLKAIAYETGWVDSGVTSASYTITGTQTQTNPPGLGSPGGDSGNGMDPRRTGVRSLGAYWGGGGEQIDLVSGNLNFSIPLLKVMSRGGWSVTFALSYNSQMWRKDSAGTWLLGYDAGYGLGWMLQAGSLVPVWNSTSQVDHYLFVDSTGAEYSLGVNNSGVWTSQEGVYVTYDSYANRLYFPDGSFWVMGSQSASGEPDAGTFYPTLIQDTNGNQITIAYDVGGGTGAVNTSSRITSITDPRATCCVNGGLGPTYTFTYGSGHLAQIGSAVGTSESYGFSYAAQPLNSPFSPSISYGSISYLQSVGVIGLSIAHTFQYDSTGTGEMTQLTTPLGGALQWQYRTFTYTGNLSLRELQGRSMNSAAGMTNSWSLAHPDSYDATLTYHYWTALSDVGSNTMKVFYTSVQSGIPLLLTSGPDEFSSDGTIARSTSKYWAQDAAGNVYLNTLRTYYDLGSPYNYSHVVTIGQMYDIYGNLSLRQIYDYGATSPTWTYNYTYLTDSNYMSRYIRNRLTQATVTLNGTVTTLASNTYDACCLIDRPNLQMHDPAYTTSFQYRGNLSVSSPDSHHYTRDIGGVTISVADGLLRGISSTPDSSTNYSLPTSVSNGNTSTAIAYSTAWAVTQVTDSNNGASSTTTYDSLGRPQTSTSADGAVTNYTYSYVPFWQTATINNPPENPGGTKWKRTWMDGFGRVIKVETGHDNTTVSTVDTQYAPCACSPLGKMYRVSQPYAPGGTPVWTTYTYDGIGRTLTVTAPDGSVTHYSYQGNQTTVTDPAGKWKTTVTDAQGNLVSVIEPNPAGGANFVTNYTYDGMNHLVGVTMTRPEGTQTRSFVYTGPDLTSATNPENGTVHYTYNAAHQVATRTDAKGQVTQYTYDSYGRLTQVTHNVGWTADFTYTYDTPIDSSFGATYTAGRLAAVTFGGYGQFKYEYSYNPSGRVITQRLATTATPQPATLDATYTWDNEGRMSARTYPGVPGSPGTAYQYQYDLMGRLSGMQDQFWNSDGTYYWQTRVTATYGPANEMTSLSYYGYNETRTYNNLLQLTRQTVAGVFDTEYVFPGGANNGQISASVDHVSGQTVNYTYDSLKRLSTAGTAGAGWGQAYSYDGFGNLTAATVTQGSGVNFAQAYDPGTNHAVGNVQFAYDANGNETWPSASYDGENRMTTPDGYKTYTYDPSGKRVWESTSGTLYFYDIFGKQIWTSVINTPSVYFGNRLVVSQNVAVVTDRLGSVRYSGGQAMSYLPYGVEQTSTPNGQVKFGTYLRDGNSSTLGADYADQRYYNPWYGRFNTPDPSTGVDLVNPVTWNKYAYADNDPANFNDPGGNVAYCPACAIFQNMINSVVAEEVNFPPGGYNPSWFLGGINTAMNQIVAAQVAAVAQQARTNTAAGLVTTALNDKSKPDCAGIFGYDPTAGNPGLNPADVLSQIVAGTHYGHLVFEDLGVGKDGTIDPQGDPTPDGKYFNVDIVINNRTDGTKYWNGSAATDLDRAQLLLHELGHLFNFLVGAGGSVFKDDDGTNMDSQTFNQNQVKKCLP